MIPIETKKKEFDLLMNIYQNALNKVAKSLVEVKEMPNIKTLKAKE